MTKKERVKNRESAVSETIGYILIFGIMMTGIGLITLYGYPLLLNEQANANIRNMERNMIVIQTDINSLTYKNVPYAETTMQVSGGVLSVQKAPGSLPYFEIDFPIGTTSTPSPIVDPYIFYPGKLRFVSDNADTVIVLENDAVNKRYQNAAGSVMISQPRWFYDGSTKTLVIPLIKINATDNFAQTGIGTIRMNLVESSQIKYDLTAAGSAVKIKYYNDYINDDFITAWDLYLDKDDLELNLDTQNNPFDITYDMDISVDYVVIKESTVTIIGL